MIAIENEREKGLYVMTGEDEKDVGSDLHGCEPADARLIDELVELVDWYALTPYTPTFLSSCVG